MTPAAAGAGVPAGGAGGAVAGRWTVGENGSHPEDGWRAAGTGPAPRRSRREPGPAAVLSGAAGGER